MTGPQKKIAQLFTESLNAQLENKESPLSLLLSQDDDDVADHTLSVIENLLSAVTGGEGRILAARESDGTLVGFVPRSMVVPDKKKEAPTDDAGPPVS